MPEGDEGLPEEIGSSLQLPYQRAPWGQFYPVVGENAPDRGFQLGGARHGGAGLQAHHRRLGFFPVLFFQGLADAIDTGVQHRFKGKKELQGDSLRAEVRDETVKNLLIERPADPFRRSLRSCGTGDGALMRCDIHRSASGGKMDEGLPGGRGELALLDLVPNLCVPKLCFRMRFEVEGVFVIQLALNPAVQDLKLDIRQSGKVLGERLSRGESAVHRVSSKMRTTYG
ncbi:hypothetical protein ACX80U_11480 [Arthrobacter sp. TmT3-37]